MIEKLPPKKGFYSDTNGDHHEILFPDEDRDKLNELIDVVNRLENHTHNISPEQVVLSGLPRTNQQECEHKTKDGKLWLWMTRGYPDDNKQFCGRCGQEKEEQ